MTLQQIQSPSRPAAPAEPAPAQGQSHSTQNHSAQGHSALRTTCGREFIVGAVRLDQVPHAAARIFISTHLLPVDQGTLWASMTVQEARRLAAFLMDHAAAAEVR